LLQEIGATKGFTQGNRGPIIAAMNLYLSVAEAAAQWLLAITAIGAAYFAFRQYRASKLFQILQFIEKPEIREARYKLFLKREITKEDKWWDQDKDLIKTASDIAASYDIVWCVSKDSHRRLIRKYWAYSICWIYEALESFVISRRDAGDRTAYQGFTNS
jgi:hypothetical protein